eukprot:Selendium_serpulae@DN6450_c2_g12_i1.p1
MCYNPSDSGPGPDTTAVICVYSRERNMFDVGFALVGLVEQDLKYKTDKQTLSGQYTSYSGDKVSCAAIFWNDGQPSTTFTGKLCRRTIRDKIDIWRLNVAYPKYRSNSILTGFWEVPVNYKDLTKLWHILKFMMDSNNGEFGILKMVCPPKRHFRCHTEIPRFEVWTNDEFCETLGLKLKKYVRRNIVYWPNQKSENDIAEWRRRPNNINAPSINEDKKSENDIPEWRRRPLSPSRGPRV